MLAKREAIVAHVEDQGAIQDAARLQVPHDAPGALVHRQQGLGIAAVVFGDVDLGMIWKINAMPAISLVLHPHGPCARIDGWRHGRRVGEGRVGVAALVPSGRNEVRVHRLVRQEQHERLVALPALQPLDGVVRQFVGDVALLRHMLAIDVQPVAAGQVGPLALETDPVVEPRLRTVALRPHVPLSNEGGLVACPLQIFREEHQAGVDGVVVVHHPVLVGVKAGEDRGAGRRTQGRGDHGVPEVHALGRQPVQLRRLQERLALHEAERIVAMVVGQDDDDVAALGARQPGQGRRSPPARRDRAGRVPGEQAHRRAQAHGAQ